MSKIEFFIYSVFSGILLGFGWPTDGFPIYLFIAFIPLLYIENYLNHSLFSILLFSFITFFTWNAISTWWLFYAKRPNGTFAIEAYLVPVLLNASFMSIIFSFYSWIKKHIKNKRIGYIFLVCLWISFEKMHLEWELSWPWLNLGNGFANRTEWIQWYEYTGILGGSIWIWIVNIGFTESIFKYKNDKNIFFLYKRIFFNIGIIFFMIFISNLIYIKYRRNHNERTANVLILQPNIDPYNQKYYTSTDKLISKLKKLIDKKISEEPMIIIAPETMFPGKGNKIQIKDINKNKIISAFKDYLRNKSPNTVFITGIELFTLYRKNQSKTSIPIFTKDKKNMQWIDIFNSVIQIGTHENVEFHHKSKLVPAVETFPYRKIFSPILGNILLNFGGTIMELGKENYPSVFKHPYLGIKIAPIICYESVFGEYVSNFFRKKNAELMVVVTNDGWWGTSQGHKQHMCYARIRAIENRKCVARSANTGISCFINEKGEIISSIPYGKEGILYDKIYLNKKKTFYIKYGDFFSRISLLTTIIILLYAITYNKIINIKFE
ncbi:apolipoprotein N-acyltransferase [Blattabacterium sp. (Blaberus giganteus)]|uniref:apolipoprotein N-acyltransferase n=1 Tax=Blattabacterium sp. (Blaberus giganteus) TaxID=1186051 RepID=UPI00025F7037|nr:apolipoprotein N-acyltransferase [Blattabacterium sp. (Blaberus giganteus)]AFJ90467.1 apolipoprotein N-acyltransferase [Blattabacterium sp. (Blaberus giganteus)]